MNIAIGTSLNWLNLKLLPELSHRNDSYQTMLLYNIQYHPSVSSYYDTDNNQATSADFQDICKFPVHHYLFIAWVISPATHHL